MDDHPFSLPRIFLQNMFGIELNPKVLFLFLANHN